MKQIVSVSSGVASAFTWHLARERHGDDVVAVFADVNFEDEDNYRFLREIHEVVGGELVWLDNDGRDIFDTFIEGRFLGNSRVDICSRVLKREAIQGWLVENYPGSPVWFGIDWTEAHRFYERRYNKKKDLWEERGVVPVYAALGSRAVAPMVEELIDKTEAYDWLQEIGVEPPLLSRMGFPHSNCGGGGASKRGRSNFANCCWSTPSRLRNGKPERSACALSLALTRFSGGRGMAFA